MLLSDCKTRWSSISTMLDRFIRIAEQVNAVMMEDRKTFDQFLQKDDLDLLSDIAKALEPLRLVTEALCHRSTNIVEAEAAMNFAVDHLKQQPSQFSKKCCREIVKR